MSDLAGFIGSAAVLGVLLSIGYVYHRATAQIGSRGNPVVASSEPEAERPPNAHAVLLWGSLDEARFPPLCPHCGNAAFGTLALSKVFWRSSGDDRSQVVISVSVPFCDECTAHHRAEVPVPGLRLKLLSSLNGEMIGAVMFGAAAMWTGYHAVDELFHRRTAIFMLFAVLCVVFCLIANSLRKSAWRETEGNGIQPASTVTRAFDYSDNDPPPFESPRYECTMRNERFAKAFKALNREIEFVPDSLKARADKHSADRRFWIVGAIVAAIVLLLALFTEHY